MFWLGVHWRGGLCVFFSCVGAVGALGGKGWRWHGSRGFWGVGVVSEHDVGWGGG